MVERHDTHRKLKDYYKEKDRTWNIKTNEKGQVVSRQGVPGWRTYKARMRFTGML